MLYQNSEDVDEEDRAGGIERKEHKDNTWERNRLKWKFQGK